MIGLYLNMRLESPTLRRYVRRGLAFSILLAYAVSAAEAVVGVVRDGDVHHESALAAAVHRAEHLPDHAFEQGGHDAHGSDHGHGSSSDHCTHIHGVSLPALCQFELVGPTPAARKSMIPAAPSQVVPTIRLRPPIA
ncbi:MAG: hypothetical protein PVH96_04195 [Gemmatimonadota bacterium]